MKRDEAISSRVSSTARKWAGFTLVELLLVVGIVALLLSVLFPALAQVRRSARRAACAANLNQIDRGLQLYANDNRGFAFPPDSGSEWWVPVPGLDTAYATAHGPFAMDYDVHITCPESEQRIMDINGTVRPVATVSYGPNWHLEELGIRRNNGSFGGVAAADIVLVGELYTGPPGERQSSLLFDREVDVRKHGNGSNYLWLDGHVSHQSPWPTPPGAVDPWDIPIAATSLPKPLRQ